MNKLLVFLCALMVGASSGAAIISVHDDDCHGSILAFEKKELRSRVTTGEVGLCSNIIGHSIERRTTYQGLYVWIFVDSAGTNPSCEFATSVVEILETGIYRGRIRISGQTDILTNEVQVYPAAECSCQVYGHGHAVGGVPW